MYARIIPAVKLPREFGAFDFIVPEELTNVVRRGTFVRVPWRNKSVEAVVLEINDHSEIAASRLKPLTETIDVPPVSEEWLKTLVDTAAECLVSPGLLLYAVMPNRPKRKRKADSADATPEQKLEIIVSDKSNHVVHRYATPQEKFDVTDEAVRRCLQSGRSAIVIAPHANDIELLKAHAIAQAWPTLERHGGISPGAAWQSWRASLAESPQVVIGTRLAIFAPLAHLGLIVIHEADSADLKQYDQNPRYDARLVAYKRATAAVADLLMLSPAPRAEEYRLTTVAGATYRQNEMAAAPIILVGAAGGSKSDERLISPAAFERTAASLQAGKKALYFHNRRGTASAMACGDCQHVFRCADCSMALAVSPQGLRCTRCAKGGIKPEGCPSCGGARLKNIGFGTVALERLLYKLFPEAKLARFDSDTDPISAANANEADILIGTSRLLHELTENPDWPRDFGVVIVPETEVLLGGRGYRTTEEARGVIVRLRDLATSGDGELLLQTANPDDTRVHDLTVGWPEAAQAELAERRRSNYPPFGFIGTITVLAETERAVQEKAAALKRQLEKVDPTIDFYPPAKPKSPFRHGRWRRLLVCRGSQAPNAALFTALRNLPEEYLIDLSPEFLE